MNANTKWLKDAPTDLPRPLLQQAPPRPLQRGFSLEFKRNYDFVTDYRKYQIMPLVDIEERSVANTVGDSKMSCDTTARDRLESVAIVVKPPGPSREPFGKDYVQRLVDEGFLAECAVEVLADAPRRF
ncbi:hypothetical protein AARAC_009119 [Aspergillus arachidicola]|uniref:Uncharacterized protein n=1 Tax=Aspergillus arachidicola TaxID=656916 RepID=A0A2G7FRN0_9EURO|nr:hypothetical protein AARAC_009119 [Aspergillus arachidicola]